MPYEPSNLGPGEHLGWSQGSDGGRVGLIFDAQGNLIKHAVWQEVNPDPHEYHYSEPVEPPELTPEQQAIAEALTALLILAVIKASPHVKRWWDETFLPAASSVMRRIVESIKTKSKAIDPAESSRTVYIAIKTHASTAIAQTEVKMTKAEWAKRYQAMLDASQFSEEQRRLLSVARIVEAEGEAKAELTPQQFAERVRLKIEANSSVLEEQNAAQVIRVLAGTKAIEL